MCSLKNYTYFSKCEIIKIMIFPVWNVESLNVDSDKFVGVVNGIPFKKQYFKTARIHQSVEIITYHFG